MTIKVSVIIPVFNAEKYLRQCLDSIVNQTLKDIEIICVDDGSTDGSLEILREYEAQDQRVKVLTQQNQFAGVARNNGMATAKGEYYTFMDADDYYLPDALSNMCAIADKYNLDLLKAAFYNLEEGEKPYDTKYSVNGNVRKQSFHKVLTRDNDLEDLVYIADVPWNGLYRASFIKENQIAFNNFRVINDHSFFVACILHVSRAMVIHQHIAYHRVNQALSLVGTKSKYYQCQIDNYSLVKELASSLPWDQKRLVMGREIDGILSWYLRLLPSAEPFYARQMERQIHEFISTFNENDVGIWHLLTMYNKDLYYIIKGEVFPNQANPCYACTVSVIIPVYNAEEYIGECLDSVCKQTFRDLEIICIDDKSTDQSLKVLTEYAGKDDRIRIVAQDKNTHQGGARNAGLDIARGKYVWFIDADDYIDSDAVAYLVENMESLKDVDLISFNGDSFIAESGKTEQTEIGVVSRRWPKNKKLCLPKDNKDIPPEIEGTCWSYFSKRVFIDSFRFRENATFEDADFTFDVLTSAGTFYELDYAPYHRRITAGSTTGEGAKGLNRDCILGRVLAAEEIYRIICKKALTSDHYAVVWAKRWFRFAFGLYLARPELHSKEYDDIIVSLQREFRPYSIQQIFATAEIRDFFFPEPVIVSLTSYPARIDRVHEVIESVINQTVCADRIILYLADEQFVDRQLPKPLVDLCTQYDCFEIHFCDDDLKPHKKYYYAMQDFPDAALITVDDDVIYPNTMVVKFRYFSLVSTSTVIKCKCKKLIDPINAFFRITIVCFCGK